MRKSGWAAATGLGSLVLLLAACGGSSSSSSAAGPGSSSGSGPATGSSPGSSGQAVTSAPASASSKGAGGTGSGSGNTANAQPTSGGVTFPPQGTTIMIVQHSNLGFVLAQANNQVVYTYARDTKNGAPTCTGTCAAQWPPVTGMPKAGPADTFPAQFGLVKGAGGVEQITYNGYPLYLYHGAKPYTTVGNGAAGLWHVVKLSASDITG